MSTATVVMRHAPAITDASAFGRYTELLDGIQTWAAEEASTCYRVAVFTERVRGPPTLMAINRTRRRERTPCACFRRRNGAHVASWPWRFA
jgi:hypothetical protein